MKERNNEMTIAYADTDADKDDINDDSSTTPTEASSTAATDFDEYADISRDTSSPSIAKSSTLTIIVATLSVLAAANPSLFTSCGNLLASFFTWYLTTLEAAPLLTKCVTGALLAILGDYGAQLFEHKSSDEQQQHKYEGNSMLQHIISLITIRGMYDYRRGWAIAMETFLLSCPLQHFAYDYFESILPVESGSELYRSFAAMVHVFLDCVALDGLFVASTIIVGGIFEGHSLTSHILPNLNHTYFSALRAALLTNLSFAPVEFLSFRFLPLPLRVLSVNAVDLVWNGVVSFASHGGAAVENAAA